MTDEQYKINLIRLQDKDNVIGVSRTYKNVLIYMVMTVLLASHYFVGALLVFGFVIIMAIGLAGILWKPEEIGKTHWPLSKANNTILFLCEVIFVVTAIGTKNYATAAIFVSLMVISFVYLPTLADKNKKETLDRYLRESDLDKENFDPLKTSETVWVY